MRVPNNLHTVDFGVSAKNKKDGQKRDTFIGTPFDHPRASRCQQDIDTVAGTGWRPRW